MTMEEKESGRFRFPHAVHFLPCAMTLPVPRLVLRLGGLGNRKFGAQNGICEESKGIEQAVTVACDTVLASIEKILTKIQRKETEAAATHGGTDPATATNFLSRWFGHDPSLSAIGGELRGEPVFSAEAPLVQVLTGGAAGGDLLIETMALQRSGREGIAYEALRIVPESPRAEPAGLGIGSLPKKDETVTARLAADGCLPRAEARALAAVVRGRAYGFRAQSEALRHHSDVLLAIWDADAEGKAGGTSESVAAALHERIPVIAIRVASADSAEIRLLTNTRHLRDLLSGQPAKPDAWATELAGLLHELLSFPPPAQTAHGSPSVHPRDAFNAFRSGRPLPDLWAGRLWQAYHDFTTFRASRSLAAAHCQYLQSPSPCPDMACGKLKADMEKDFQKFRRSFADLFGPKAPPPNADNADQAERKPPLIGAAEFRKYYGAARDRAASSGLGGVYGNAHRGGLVASFLLGLIAVALAVTGGILHHFHVPTPWLVLIAILEVMAIGTMLQIVLRSRQEDWNSLYTNCRILAEALRMMAHLGPLGVHTPLPRLPYYLRGNDRSHDPARQWSTWYFRALVRNAPLRLGPVPDPAAIRSQIIRELGNPQLAYHEKTSRRQETAHHDSESTIWFLFAAISCCALLHLADAAFHLHWNPVAIASLFVCTVGPAAIAAIHGVASEIEVERLKDRADSMVTLLRDRITSLDSLPLASSSSHADAIWGLTTESLALASLLIDETAGWSLLYRTEINPA